MTVSPRCYVLPLLGGVSYFLLTIPPVEAVFEEVIPDPYYRIIAIGLLIMLILYIGCCLLDRYWGCG